jgi:cyclopropane fatty-acyl-phospholipid synthase-like methyltransferase
MYLDKTFLKENMMGPNAVKLAEELTAGLPLEKGMRVLDLGCGRGLTSIYLAKTFQVEVFAVDLWNDPGENYSRFRQAEVSRLTVPLQVDASKGLPFAKGFFDAVVSVDAYHYFGNREGYFQETLLPCVKKGGYVAMAFPGMQQDLQEIPAEMKPYWDMEFLSMVRSMEWWKPKFAPYLKDFSISSMDCFQEAWEDWLACDNNPYAVGDRPMMAADNGNYMNLIKFTGIAP